jgi:hypothetical protein
MKKLLLSVFVLTSILTNTSAQAQEKGFYASLNTGYNFGASTNKDYQYGEFLEFYNYTTDASGESNYEAIALSLGKGLNVNASFGYNFTKNIAVELGINYLLGSETTALQTNASSNFRSESKFSAKMLQIKPTLVLSAGYDKINPYAKFGVVIGTGKANLEVSGTSTGFSTNSNYELSEGTPIGFHGGIGLTYSLNSKISLFGEITSVNLNFSPKKGKLTEATVNGVDQLPLMDVEDKEIDFVDTFYTGTVTSPNQPSKSPAFALPFSSLGLNVGVKYNF